jgi:hypothetical protein
MSDGISMRVARSDSSQKQSNFIYVHTTDHLIIRFHKLSIFTYNQPDGGASPLNPGFNVTQARNTLHKANVTVLISLRHPSN